MDIERVLNPFPILETTRLRLRQIQPSDREAMFALFGDVEVTRYNDVDTLLDISQAEDIIDFIQGRWEARSGIRWGITLKDDDKSAMIGTCGFNGWNLPCRRAVIGYDLQQAYWGRGIMPEAVHAMMQFGFGALNLNRIEADVTVGNAASGRVLRKVGFTFEGVMRQRGCWKGAFHDLEMYSLLREEYVSI